ncbi:hypothetical protein PAPYR_6866 [Paratrimastix pyriformis]|uniref:Uncharacterized protein n=1 Tax=Paratrimastix pyriformis TaxID=342808 RepID=A0ABQ8ULI1_9EUKA|nr:hypothetical protein PAPYR_6866 [Paratrimastix pyriformis]
MWLVPLWLVPLWLVPLWLVPLRLVPMRLVPMRLVPLWLVPLWLVPLWLVPLWLVPLWLVPLWLVPMRLVPMRLVPMRLVPMRLVPMRLGPMRLGPMRLGPMRLGPMRLVPMRLVPMRLVPMWLVPTPPYVLPTRLRLLQLALSPLLPPPILRRSGLPTAAHQQHHPGHAPVPLLAGRSHSLPDRVHPAAPSGAPAGKRLGWEERFQSPARPGAGTHNTKYYEINFLFTKAHSFRVTASLSAMQELHDLTPFEPPKFMDPLVVGSWARFASPQEEYAAGHFDERDQESPQVQQELFVDTRCLTLVQEVTTRLTRPQFRPRILVLKGLPRSGKSSTLKICARMLSDQATAPGVMPWNRVYYFRQTTTANQFSFLKAENLRKWETPCLVILDQFVNEPGLQDKINLIVGSPSRGRITFLICSSANFDWVLHASGGESVPEDVTFQASVSWADFYRVQTRRSEVPPQPHPLAEADWFTFVPTRGGRGLNSPPFSPEEWGCTTIEASLPPLVPPPTDPEALAAFWGDVFLYSNGILGIGKIVSNPSFLRQPPAVLLCRLMTEYFTVADPGTRLPAPPHVRRCILDEMVHRRTIRFPRPEGERAVDFRFAVGDEEGGWRLACPFFAQLYMKVLGQLPAIPIRDTLLPMVADQPPMRFDDLEEVKRAVIANAPKLLRVPNFGIGSGTDHWQFYLEPFVKGPASPRQPAFPFLHLVPMSSRHPDIDLVRIYDAAAATTDTATATTAAPHQPPRQVVLLADRIAVSDVASHTSALRWILSAECATVCRRIQEVYGCPPQRKVFVFMTKAAGIRLGPLGDDICRAVHAEGWEVWWYPLELFFGLSSRECPSRIRVPEAPKKCRGPIIEQDLWAACEKGSTQVDKLFTAKALRAFLVAKKMPGVTQCTKAGKPRMVELALGLYRREGRMGDGTSPDPLRRPDDTTLAACGLR